VRQSRRPRVSYLKGGRAIVYRIDNGFDHFKMALSVGVMKMVRSDRAASGVIFTLDTEPTGARPVGPPAAAAIRPRSSSRPRTCSIPTR